MLAQSMGALNWRRVMAGGRIPGPITSWLRPGQLPFTGGPEPSPGVFALPGPIGVRPAWMHPALSLPHASLDPVLTRMDQAKALVGHLERVGRNGVFTKIPYTDVASGLRMRLAQPGGIDQGQSSLCGPAALVFRILTHDPLDYVKFVVDLYWTGTASMGNLKITAGVDVRKFDPTKGAMQAVDWIALASIRDSENWFFDYQSSDDEFAGITLPSHMESWFKKIGYTSVINRTSLTHDQNEQNLREADKLFGEGYWVCLLINAQVLDPSSQNNIAIVPDHWVVLRSRIQFGPRIYLEVFSWGDKQYSIPHNPAVPLSTEHFLDFYNGFVAAKD
jgi:hypothetical protein